MNSEDSNAISSDSDFYSEIKHTYTNDSFPEFQPEQHVNYDKSAEELISPKLKSTVGIIKTKHNEGGENFEDDEPPYMSQVHQNQINKTMMSYKTQHK